MWVCITEQSISQYRIIPDGREFILLIPFVSTWQLRFPLIYEALIKKELLGLGAEWFCETEKVSR